MTHRYRVQYEGPRHFHAEGEVPKRLVKLNEIQASGGGQIDQASHHRNSLAGVVKLVIYPR